MQSVGRLRYVLESFDYENRAEKTEDKLKMAQIIRLAEQLCKEQSAPFRTDDRC